MVCTAITKQEMIGRIKKRPTRFISLRGGWWIEEIVSYKINPRYANKKLRKEARNFARGMYIRTEDIWDYMSELPDKYIIKARLYKVSKDKKKVCVYPKYVTHEWDRIKNDDYKELLKFLRGR